MNEENKEPEVVLSADPSEFNRALAECGEIEHKSNLAIDWNEVQLLGSKLSESLAEIASAFDEMAKAAMNQWETIVDTFFTEEKSAGLRKTLRRLGVALRQYGIPRRAPGRRARYTISHQTGRGLRRRE